MSKAQHVRVVVQLFLTFTVLFGILVQPYLLTRFACTAHLYLIDSVLEHRWLLENHEQELLQTHRDDIPLESLVLPTSPYAKAWIVFSVLTCLLLLLQAQGAAQAAWLLPIISLIWWVDPAPPHVESDLYSH